MGAGCCGGGGGGQEGGQRPAMTEEQEKIAKWVRYSFYLFKNDFIHICYRWYVKTKNAPVRGGEKVDWFTGQGK